LRANHLNRSSAGCEFSTYLSGYLWSVLQRRIRAPAVAIMV
jgi:hypothetical protein